MMFAGLFHAVRSLAGGVAELVSDLGWAATYRSDDAVNPIAAMTVTFKRDGSWTITVGAGDVLTGAPSSGNWSSNPSASVGDDYEVEYTNANNVNTPTITNNAPTYTQLSVDRTFLISRGAGVQASTDLTVKVRRIGTTTPVLQETATLTVDGT